MTKTYTIVVTPNAAADLTDQFDWLGERNPRAANEWLARMRKVILGLSSMPHSHALAPESAEFDIEIRRALYGRSTRWRIYFTIDGETVHILHVRHGRQRDWQP
jgi:toxin ParE1/3/4